MALSERLAYVLDFNVDGAVKGLQKVGTTADKELGKAEQKLDKLSGNLTKYGAGAVAFAGVAGAALVKMASGAAEAEANTAALRQVVDELAATQIEAWANNSAEAVGLARKEAIAATTGFAGLGKIIGLTGPELAGFSTELVGMAADMAAFKDVSPQQALADLQSLFAGSTEVGRKYNIFLDDATLKSAYFRETGEKVTGTLTAQQRIIATNSELYRQGADMMGQWGRESGGLAGQQAQLSANLTDLSDSIGAGVLPMLTKVVGSVNATVKAFASLPDPMKESAGQFAAIGAAGVALIGTLSVVAGQVIKMRDRFVQADGTLTNFGKAARGVGVAMGVAAAALAVYTANQASNAKATQHSIDLFNELGRVADAELADGLVKALYLAELGGKSLDEAMQLLAKSNIEVARRTLETGAAAGVSAEAEAALAKAIADEEKARSQANTTAEEYGDTTDEVTVAVKGTTQAQQDAVHWTGEYERHQKDLTKAKEEAAKATDRQRQAEENLLNFISGKLDSVFTYEQATMDLATANQSLATNIAEVEQAWADGTITQAEYEQALRDLRTEEISTAEQARATAEAFAESKGAAADSTAGVALQKEELRRLQEQFPQLRDEIQLYIDILNKIPASKNTNVTLNGAVRAGSSRNPNGTNADIALKTGGPVPGPRDAPVPITAHGGEFVLSADVVDAVKRGSTTQGLGASGGSVPGRAGVHIETVNINSGMDMDGFAAALNTKLRFL